MKSLGKGFNVVVILLTLLVPFGSAYACRPAFEKCNKGLCTIECCSKKLGVRCHKVNDGYMCYCQPKI